MARPEPDEPLPLWEALDKYFPATMEMLVPGLTKRTIADLLEDLRDRIVPQEPEPGPWKPEWRLWNERQRIRAELTRQAALARGEAP